VPSVADVPAEGVPASARPDVTERLREAEETLAAIGAEVDGIVVRTPAGERVVLTAPGVERPYRMLVEGMSEGAATLAPDGTILYANRRVAEMLERPLTEIVGASLFDFVDAEADAVLRAALRDGAATRWRGEILVRSGDAHDVPVHLSFTPLALDGGLVVLSLLLTDLRAQRRTDAVVAAGRLARRIFEQASEAIVVCDEAGVVRELNRAAQHLAGGAVATGSEFRDTFALVGAEAGFDFDVQSLLAEPVDRLRVVLHRAHATVQLLASSSKLAGPDGRPAGTVVTLTDVTDLHEANRKLERYARLQRSLAELGGAALAGSPLADLAAGCRRVLADVLEGATVRVSGSFAAADEVADAVEAPHEGVVRRAISTHEHTVGTLEVDPGRGRSLTADDIGLLDNVASMLSLAAEQQMLHARLHHQAHHDALTGLPNRVLLEERLRRAMASATLDGSAVAVLFIDLDRFKHVNDTLGHHAGNEVLVQVGRRLRDHARGSDTVARFGGDEFVVVYGGLRDAGTAVGLASAIAETLARPIEVGGRSLTVRATVGIATFPRDGTETETLITKSDSAMYHGKSGGRNTIRLFSEHMNELTAARLDLERDFERALTRGGLELHFQPQVCARTGVITGLEALARWHHPRHGWVAPSRFVPLAEEMGLVADLGAWAIGEACRTAGSLSARSHAPLRVSVNVSPAHIARPGFVGGVQRALQDDGLEGARLELEVTESVMMHDADSVVRPLEALRELGVRVALDDFGLGYSSFSSLAGLPLDRLKVDKSLVDTRTTLAGRPENQRAVLLGITTMAQALGLSVTIEGVETAAELELARSVECDEVQGFFVGAVAPASDIVELLRRGPVQAVSGRGG
jgi:diguanylate cyclase (GGDEF)-like protein/PAS domain S-box-containing protein